MSIWWSLHLRREAASVPLARRLLIGAMETAGVDPETSYELAVALSEACANAVEHGGDADTAYRVTAFIDGDTCRIEVTDSGPGFAGSPRRPARRRTAARAARGSRTPTAPRASGAARAGGTSRTVDTLGAAGSAGSADSFEVRARTPAPAHEEHGRGLFLIASLTDHVRVHNRPGHQGSVVSFDKILKWRDGAPPAAALLRAS
ncbi:ATP-binding protein [Streptomyces sp. NPDC049577]|uniref:ATP-binding protein n=1 Tax=Streptomyces sp. NPDC049577 TaxID=3155153 RepID=UPI00343ACAF5